jgi:hypothetical protein
MLYAIIAATVAALRGKSQVSEPVPVVESTPGDVYLEHLIREQNRLFAVTQPCKESDFLFSKYSTPVTLDIYVGVGYHQSGVNMGAVARIFREYAKLEYRDEVAQDHAIGELMQRFRDETTVNWDASNWRLFLQPFQQEDIFLGFSVTIHQNGYRGGRLCHDPQEQLAYRKAINSIERRLRDDGIKYHIHTS